MELQLIRGKLPELNDKAIERAVQAFIQSIEIHGEVVGFYNQTIKSIYHAVFDGTSDFWLAHRDGEVTGYALGRTAVDIDDRLCYWVTQAWVSPKMRGKKDVKVWWQSLRTYAKDRLCRHILIISARGTDAYCRWLGKGWAEYARILKEDI